MHALKGALSHHGIALLIYHLPFIRKVDKYYLQSISNFHIKVFQSKNMHNVQPDKCIIIIHCDDVMTWPRNKVFDIYLATHDLWPSEHKFAYSNFYLETMVPSDSLRFFSSRLSPSGVKVSTGDMWTTGRALQKIKLKFGQFCEKYAQDCAKLVRFEDWHEVYRPCGWEKPSLSGNGHAVVWLGTKMLCTELP